MSTTDQSVALALDALTELNDIIAGGIVGSPKEETEIRGCLLRIQTVCSEHAHIARLCRFVGEHALAVVQHPDDIELRRNLNGSLEVLAGDIRQLRDGDEARRRTGDESEASL